MRIRSILGFLIAACLIVGVCAGFLPIRLHNSTKEEVPNPLANKKKRVVLIAGSCSHGPGQHEHQAGCVLLAQMLNKNVPGIQADVYAEGWPKDPRAFDNAAAVVMYSDGGEGHMVNPHLDELAVLMKKGVGLACIHYAVEVPKGKPGDYFLNWIGGYFETYWSVNPVWQARFDTLPRHPITRGVKPFQTDDEWYYHMRFPEKMTGVTTILSAVPPRTTLERGDGAREGNPAVRAEAGKPQTLAWCRERPDGGRGFGITSGHFHRNWTNDDYRKLVLNAIAWVAKADVPKAGVPSQTPAKAAMAANLCRH